MVNIQAVSISNLGPNSSYFLVIETNYLNLQSLKLINATTTLAQKTDSMFFSTSETSAVCSSPDELNYLAVGASNEEIFVQKISCHSTCETCSTANDEFACETCPVGKVLRTDNSCNDTCQADQIITLESKCEACPPGYTVQANSCSAAMAPSSPPWEKHATVRYPIPVSMRK